MTTIERLESQTGQEDEIAVSIVDTDVHPVPLKPEVLKSYAPPEWVDKIWSTGKAGAVGNPVSMVLNSNQPSGSVNILDDLKWLESAGYMKSGSGINQIDFGWELCSTGGAAQTFTLSQYSIKATCTSGSSCTQ